MGHDISAFKNPPDWDSENPFDAEVAYLRRSAFCADRHVIYEVLDAPSHNGGVSGMGETALFTVEDLETAIRKAREESAEEDIIQFLEKSLAAAKQNEKGVIHIHFG